MRVSHLQAGGGWRGQDGRRQEAGCSSAATNFLTRQHKLPPAPLIIPLSTRITPSHRHLWPAFIPLSSDTTVIVSCPMSHVPAETRCVWVLCCCWCCDSCPVTRSPVSPHATTAQCRHARHPHPPAGLLKGVIYIYSHIFIDKCLLSKFGVNS